MVDKKYVIFGMDDNTFDIVDLETSVIVENHIMAVKRVEDIWPLAGKMEL